MENTLLSTAVILFAFNLIGLDFSPIQISKTLTDSNRCDSTLEDLHIPHESDCSKYYRCVYGTKVLKICPEKMLFNRNIGNCDLFYNVVDCPTEKQPEDDLRVDRNSEEAIEHLTGKTYHVKNKGARAQTDSIESNALDERTITKQLADTTTRKFVYILHEENPGAYYQIENGIKSLMVCDEGMIFSLDLEICARPWVMK